MGPRRSADTYAPGPPCCTYGGDAHQPREASASCVLYAPALPVPCAPAFCMLCVPEALGSLPRGSHALRVPATGVPYVQRTVAPPQAPHGRPANPSFSPNPSPSPMPNPKPYPLPYPEPPQPRRATPGSSSTPTPTPTPGSKDSENHSAMLRCARLTAPTPTPESTPTPNPDPAPTPNP